MKHARIIVVLVLLALSFSGCANADYFDGTPSSEETAMAEPVLSTAPQERTTVSVSESTEIFAESTAEPETVEIPPEVQYLSQTMLSCRQRAAPWSLRRRKHPNPNHQQSLRKHSRRNLSCPAKKNPQNRRLTFRLGSTMPKPMPKA